MSTIFTKTYTGKIKRLLSEGQICPSDIPEVYVEKEDNQIEINLKGAEETYPSKIFNIIKKKNVTEITTNTLSILISNIEVDGIPYYFKLYKTPTDLSLLNDDYVLVNGVVYLNTNKKYLNVGDELITVIPVLGLDIWNKDPRINIRRLKDRFKITVKIEDELFMVLPKSSILEPNVYKSWVYFNDCISNFNNEKQPSYLYTSSFEYYNKTEVHKKGEGDYQLRDLPLGEIVIEDIIEDYVKISYKTYRSNLFINSNYNKSDLYISIERNSVATYLNVHKNPNEQSDIIIKNPSSKIIKVIDNPYKYLPKYTSRPEIFYFTWETESKYAKALNVPIGCKRIVLDFKKILNRSTVNYTLEDGTVIKENNYQTSATKLNTTPAPSENNLAELVSMINFNT